MRKFGGKTVGVKTVGVKTVGVVALVAAILVAGCSSNTPTSAPSNATEGGLPLGQKAKGRKAGDTAITYESGGATVHGSLRMPKGSGAVPAAVIIAGSGPTDRDGNNKALPGNIGTLSWLAEQLEADGVASLRYDKLGTGKTGMGPFASRPGEVDFEVFVQEARDALIYLAAQPDIDTTKLMIVGHSEGGLIALVASTDPRGAPGATALALINPLPVRYLDLVAEQLRTKVDAATNAAAQRATEAIRAGRPLPTGLPPALQSIFAPQNEKFLRQADQIDPVSLAAKVDPSVKALVACSDHDIQVPCPPVQALAAAFPPGVATSVTFTGTNHVLKEATTSDGSEYTQPLSYSSSAQAALKQLVDTWRA